MNRRDADSSIDHHTAAQDRELHTKTLTTPIKLCSDPNCTLPEGHAKPFHVPLYVLLQEAGYVKGPWSR